MLHLLHNYVTKERQILHSVFQKNKFICLVCLNFCFNLLQVDLHIWQQRLTKPKITLKDNQEITEDQAVIYFKYKNVGLLRTAYQPVGPVVKCKIVVSGLTLRS